MIGAIDFAEKTHMPLVHVAKIFFGRLRTIYLRQQACSQLARQRRRHRLLHDVMQHWQGRYFHERRASILATLRHRLIKTMHFFQTWRRFRRQQRLLHRGQQWSLCRLATNFQSWRLHFILQTSEKQNRSKTQLNLWSKWRDQKEHVAHLVHLLLSHDQVGRHSWQSDAFQYWRQQMQCQSHFKICQRKKQIVQIFNFFF